MIEATRNQVIQNGGYAGRKAANIMFWLTGIAGGAGVPMELLILGGDHLGPNPSRSEPIDAASENARAVIVSHVQAGQSERDLCVVHK